MSGYIQQKAMVPPPIQSAMTGDSGQVSPLWDQWFRQALTPRVSGSLVSVTLTGDVTGSGAASFDVTINAGAVTLAKMAPLVATSLIGNNGGAVATPAALTPAQVVAMLPAGGDLSGTYDAPAVVALRGKALPALAVGLLAYSGSAFSFTTTPNMAAYQVAGVQVIGAQQTGLGATLPSTHCGATYTATEQGLINALIDKVVLLETKLKLHGLVAT